MFADLFVCACFLFFFKKKKKQQYTRETRHCDDRPFDSGLIWTEPRNHATFAAFLSNELLGLASPDSWDLVRPTRTLSTSPFERDAHALDDWTGRRKIWHHRLASPKSQPFRICLVKSGAGGCPVIELCVR
jgi:hypothetical protein